MTIIMSPHPKRLAALKKALYALSDIPGREWEDFSRRVGERFYRPNECLVRAGAPMNNFFFIFAGLVRYYYTTEDGKEFNKSFAPENSFVGSFGSGVGKAPCRFTIQALEQTEALVLPVSVILAAYERHHSWERVGRKMAERVAISKDVREGEFLLDSAEARYRRFLTSNPDLAKRLNQYHIASYLGLTDVGLSRIRKKMGMIDNPEKK